MGYNPGAVVERDWGALDSDRTSPMGEIFGADRVFTYTVLEYAVGRIRKEIR